MSSLIPLTSPHQRNRECIFGTVFRDCISKNKKQRQGLFKNLLNLFQLKELVPDESPKKRKTKRADFDVALLGFTAEILAYLPYTTTSDPLIIIYHIRHLVGLQGEQVIDALAEVLCRVGLASEDKFDDRNAGEDALEQAARSKFPSKTPESAALSKEGMDMTKFVRLCQAAAALTLLLRLKRFLRQMYNLSEARCLEFDPNEKEKVAEKGVNKSDVKTIFDSTTVKKDDMDDLIRQYAEFRQLMREESTILSSKDADSDLEDTDMAEPLIDEVDASNSGKRKNSDEHHLE